MNGEEVALRTFRHAGCTAHQALSVGGARQCHDDTLARLPGPLDPVPFAILLQRVVDTIGDPEERELAQRSEVPRTEVVPKGCVDPLCGVDVPVRHATADSLRRHVYEIDLVRPAHDGVGDRLLLLDAGDLLDDVVDRVEVLDIQGRDHRDPGLEQRLHVLPALLVARSRDVRMRELVDEGHVGQTREDRVEIHLLEGGAAVLDRHSRHDLETCNLVGGLRAAVSLDVADDDIRSTLGAPATFAEHRKRLADSGGSPEVDAERSPCHSRRVTYFARSSARFSSSTFTPGSPRNPSERPSVWLATMSMTCESGRFRSFATRTA